MNSGTTEVCVQTPAHPGIVHELSQEGQRPFCGADPIREPLPEGAEPVNCKACLRLLEDDVRGAAHAAHPHADESED